MAIRNIFTLTNVFLAKRCIKVKNNLCFKYSHTCFEHESETGEERNLVISKDKSINNSINGMVSSKAL